MAAGPGHSDVGRVKTDEKVTARSEPVLQIVRRDGFRSLAFSSLLPEILGW